MKKDPGKDSLRQIGQLMPQVRQQLDRVKGDKRHAAIMQMGVALETPPTGVAQRGDNALEAAIVVAAPMHRLTVKSVVPTHSWTIAAVVGCVAYNDRADRYEFQQRGSAVDLQSLVESWEPVMARRVVAPNPGVVWAKTIGEWVVLTLSSDDYGDVRLGRVHESDFAQLSNQVGQTRRNTHRRPERFTKPHLFGQSGVPVDAGDTVLRTVCDASTGVSPEVQFWRVVSETDQSVQAQLGSVSLQAVAFALQECGRALINPVQRQKFGVALVPDAVGPFDNADWHNWNKYPVIRTFFEKVIEAQAFPLVAGASAVEVEVLDSGTWFNGRMAIPAAALSTESISQWRAAPHQVFGCLRECGLQSVNTDIGIDYFKSKWWLEPCFAYIRQEVETAFQTKKFDTPIAKVALAVLPQTSPQVLARAWDFFGVSPRWYRADDSHPFATATVLREEFTNLQFDPVLEMPTQLDGLEFQNPANIAVFRTT